MKRDFNLIRKLLINIEESCDPQDGDALKIEGYNDRKIIQHHLHFLIEKGLIDGKEIKTMSGISHFMSLNLTWDGHNFLDSIQNEKVWQKVNKKLKVLGDTASLEVIKQITIQVARQLL